ncbi:hypothetical protein B0T22DRAFT_532730 [Podospora appendiculata]|uniref:FluG domain-containing protein n=1 Tax=Podospora appendiculata TaxID=314037 RepID=A0AAE0XHC8_9PEZI|nr:hypothetical protein B0T22DRAFT_532730 [Podospora appendiculata]
MWRLRREPRIKPIMGPDFFIYHLYYLWHELIYAKPRDLEEQVKYYDEESDAYTDVDCTTDKYIKPRVKTCWVCDEPDERDNSPKLKVLCWEDIDLWILRDPEKNGGRDRLGMQKLPVLCPITHILAKALAEGVIANEGYQTKADPFFATKLNKRALKIRWKKEWLHKPVFRKTNKVSKEESEFEELCAKSDSARAAAYESVQSAKRGLFNLWEKSDDAQTAATFDNRSERLRILMELLEPLAQYSQSRGFAECLGTHYSQAVRDQGLRHKANSTVYQECYHNAKMNAVVQDAFLGRSTQTPYLAIFNHMGLRLDENAPKRVPDEMMRMIGPNAAVRRLEQRLEDLQTALRQKYGRPSWATEDEIKQYETTQAQLSAARQKQRRKVFRKLYKNYFIESDDQELQNQLQGIREPLVEREVTHSLPERRILADIMGDMDEDLPEEDILRRKVEAINAMVAYAFVCEPFQPNSTREPEPSSILPSLLAMWPEPSALLHSEEAGTLYLLREGRTISNAPKASP